jgi:hypothetical protein
MEPELVEFPNWASYGGTVRTAKHFLDGRPKRQELKDILDRHPMLLDGTIIDGNNILWAVEDGVGKEDDTDSTTNEVEATLAVRIVEALIRCGVKPKQFLLLSGYHKQVLCKQEKPRLAGLSNIPVKSVDNSIAKTADFVILSLARTSQGPGIGFIREDDRLVVTLTRGRYLRHVLCERSFFLTEGEDYNIKHFCEWMDDKKKVRRIPNPRALRFPVLLRGQFHLKLFKPPRLHRKKLSLPEFAPLSLLVLTESLRRSFSTLKLLLLRKQLLSSISGLTMQMMRT